jgi:hypothetical protein
LIRWRELVLAWYWRYILFSRKEIVMASPKKASTSAQVNSASQSGDIESRIRQRAYEIYEATGREEGHELDHWLKAETEVLGARAQSVSA